MQQKMLSDQQGKACATSQKEAEKKFIKDSLARWGCVYAIFLSNLLAARCGGLPTYLCDRIFMPIPAAYLPQQKLLTKRCEIAKGCVAYGTAATQKNSRGGSCALAIFFCGASRCWLFNIKYL